ncbi:MAG: hypothetical protein LEGION0398_MBIBDBAK_01246 [Legionellaceae bacterium]
MFHIEYENLQHIFDYTFMQHAFIAGTFAAILASITGYFMALRNLTFAGHALSHVGFAGAAAAGLAGVSPLLGQLLITILAALGMGSLNEQVRRNDFIIGIILALTLGLGSLFLHFYNSYAGQTTSLLFGDLLGVSSSAIKTIAFLTIGCILALAIIARPMLFASIEIDLAEAKGVPVNKLTSVFLIIMAIAVTLASQVVGVLLVFTLLIGPAAIALQWTRTFWMGILSTVILSVSIVWISIVLTYLTDWPISFWISCLVFIGYLIGNIYKAYR